MTLDVEGSCLLTAVPGEKIVPIPQEGYIGSLPYVSGVVMFGREKTQAGVLVELREKYAFDPKNEEAVRAFRNNIWCVFYRIHATPLLIL